MKKEIRWIFILSAAVYFCQGIESLPGLAFNLYMKEKLHLTASLMMYLTSITTLAWLIKPLWGYLCDNYLNKKTWVLISLLGSTAICLYLALSPFLALALIIPLLALAGWNAAIRDVAVDGIMCVEGKESNSCDRIQAIQWTAITVAGIVSSLVGGYVAEHFNYQLGYACLIPFYLIIIGLVSKYKIEDKHNCTSCSNYYEGVAVGDDKLRCHRNFVAQTIGFVSKNFACGYYCENKKPKFLDTIKSYKILFTDKKFLIACLFLFLFNYSPSFGTPLFFIKRDSFQWSAGFLGILGAISSVFSIIGALIFYKYCKRFNLKKLLIYSVFIGAAANLCYLYYTPISAVAYDTIFSIAAMLIRLIILSFLAQITIEGKEATSFALGCSIVNLAGTASEVSGAFLLPIIGLTGLIIISAGTSFLCLPLIPKIFKGKNE